MNIKGTFIAICSILSLSTVSISNADPNFELYNKGKQPIGFTIEYPVNQMFKGIVAPLKNNRQTIAPGVDTLVLTIYEGVTRESDIEKTTVRMSGKEFTIKLPKGKTTTVYLTWNPIKPFALYPQTGPLMGFLGKTESGLSLRNNIKADQILAR